MGDGCDFARWEEYQKLGQSKQLRVECALGRVEVVRDDVAEKLDEMADLCEYWKRNRDRGYHPNAIRAALITLAEEVVALTGIKGAR